MKLFKLFFFAFLLLLTFALSSSFVEAQSTPQMYVLWPPSSLSPNYPDIKQYLMSNPVVAGAIFSVKWSEVDKGPGANPQYVWTSVDDRLKPWIAAGKKVNLVVWPVSYGSSNTATPSYVMKDLGSSNIATCGGGEQIPNYFASAYLGPYEAFIKQVIQHYAGNSSVGYIRFGLGQGGEIYPVFGMQKDSACYNKFLNWGWSENSWSSYLGTLMDYEKSLKSPHQLMIGVTFVNNPATTDAIAARAVSDGIGIGNQGLQLSDTTNYPAGKPCQGDWCHLFDTYTGQVPLELQTFGKSQPSNAKPTGSLVTLLPFALSRHTTSFEVYWEDWLIAYAPDYPGYSTYHTAYANVLQATSQGK